MDPQDTDTPAPTDTPTPPPTPPPTPDPTPSAPRNDDPPAWVEELRTSIGALPESIANAMREATSAVTPAPTPTPTQSDEKGLPASTESERPKASPRPKARPKAESVPNEPAPGQSFKSWWFGR